MLRTLTQIRIRCIRRIKYIRPPVVIIWSIWTNWSFYIIFFHTKMNRKSPNYTKKSNISHSLLIIFKSFFCLYCISYLGFSKRITSSSAAIQVYRFGSPWLKNDVGRLRKYEFSTSSSCWMIPGEPFVW